MNTNSLTAPAVSSADLMAMFRAMVKDMTREAFNELRDEFLQFLHPTKPVEESDHMDRKGAIEFLNSRGYKISPAQMYKLTSTKSIPYQKISGSNRLHFYKSQLEEWINMKLTE